MRGACGIPFTFAVSKQEDMEDLKKLVAKYLREIADRFEADTSDVSETQAIDILRMVAHESLSKEQACTYLNLSRSRFDDLVRERRLPKGKKIVGLKELIWWKDDLDIAMRKCKAGKNWGGVIS